MRALWLVHTGDGIATVYTLDAGRYGKPQVTELQGSLASTVLPQVAVDWARALR